MIDLGTVRPGSTIRIPFGTYDKDDGSSITLTNDAVGDILVYKDGSTTERASTVGFTFSKDFDTKTGKHVVVLDLADDTTADFWKAGSEYLVAIDAVTVDAVTTGGWIARFRIGYPNAYLDTSIATLASQTSFTLTAGPAEDDALNGMVLLVHDKASAVQVTRVVVEDYTGSTKTVTLRAAPATTFTIAAGDNVSAVGFDTSNVTHVSGTAVTWSATRGLAGTALPNAAADAAGGLPISDAGGLDLDALNTAAVRLTAARAQIIDDWVNGGRLDLILDIIAADTTTDIPALLSTIAGYLDTEVAAIKAKTDNLPAAPAATGDIPTANANADALLDRAAGVETGVTVRQALRGILSSALAKLSGAATTTVVIRDVNDTKNRVSATVDADGNRSAVTLDLT